MSDPLNRLAAALADRYALDSELGAGGMATVYLAEDLKHHRKVAVKVLRPDLAANLGAERFVREISVAANLQHPHLVPLYDSGEAAGFLFYVMPYIDGPSLRIRLIREGELPINEAVRILRDLADAMTYAHAHGVVHRDIKPENIMLSGRHALVTDFGVAKAVSEATGRQTLTTAGVALGTPTYMAPEQAAADPRTDHRADIYAFGIVAYELLTGRPPFTGASPQALLAAHLTTAADPVTKHRSSIPPALATLVMRCLEKNPADRQQQAEELVHQLEAMMTASGGMTPTQTQPMRITAPARRRQRLAMAAGGMTLLAVVVLGAISYRWNDSGSPGPEVREPVVVVPFEVQGSDSSLEGLGVQAAGQIAAAIEQASLGRVVTYRPKNGGEAFTEAVGRRIVQETSAGTLVTGVISKHGEQVQVLAKVVRGADLATVWSLGPDQGAASDATGALDKIRERVLGAVGTHLSPLWAGRNASIYQPPPTLEIFRLQDKAGNLARDGQFIQATRLLEQAYAHDTTWLAGAIGLVRMYASDAANDDPLKGRIRRDSLITLVEARRSRLFKGDALTFDWLVANVRGSPEDEYELAQARLRDDPGVLYDAMVSARRANHLDEALRLYALRDTTALRGENWQEWDAVAATAYHDLGRFQEELALIRAARRRLPESYAYVLSEVGALAALGRTDEIEPLITVSYALKEPGAPTWLMHAAAAELDLHGFSEAAKSYAERCLTGVSQLPDNVRESVQARNVRRHSLRILGRFDNVRRLYLEQERLPGRELTSRLLGMRFTVLMGDTTGAEAMVELARTAPPTAFYSGWSSRGSSLYYGAQVLALLGRKEEAVQMFREALNNGWRVNNQTRDEPLQWHWAPLKDYPPFLELVRVRNEP